MTASLELRFQISNLKSATRNSFKQRPESLAPAIKPTPLPRPEIRRMRIVRVETQINARSLPVRKLRSDCFQFFTQNLLACCLPRSAWISADQCSPKMFRAPSRKAVKDFGIEHMNAGKVGWDQRATRAPAHRRQRCHRWAGAAYQPLVPPYGAFASISGFSTSGCRGWANAGFRRNVENISPQATDSIRIRHSIFIGIPFLR